MNKKTFFAISLLLSNNLYTQTAPSANVHVHVASSSQGVTASSELITVLQDIASLLSSSTNTSALVTILQQLNTGINSFDIQLFEQALQEALGILASSGGKLNAFTVIEYTGILVETIAQLEAARVQSSSSAATSTVVTSTVH